MAKNLIPEACKLLGVEVDERFKVKNCQYKNREFFISENGNVVILPDENGYYCYHDVDLEKLLTGEQEIVKLPWEPKPGEVFYSFVKPSANTLMVINDTWFGLVSDLARLKAGWVYRTREEAEAALPKVAEELGVEYEK